MLLANTPSLVIHDKFLVLIRLCQNHSSILRVLLHLESLHTEKREWPGGDDAIAGASDELLHLFNNFPTISKLMCVTTQEWHPRNDTSKNIVSDV